MSWIETKFEEPPKQKYIWFLIAENGDELHKFGIIIGNDFTEYMTGEIYELSSVIAFEDRWQKPEGNPETDKKYMLKVKYKNKSEEYRVAIFTKCGCGQSKFHWKYVDVYPQIIKAAHTQVIEWQQIEY